ncbi:hypothetical protein CDIK_0916 [Cucumispora dikerogammari]|nr:hypothetical protein CDIK_0916 [Cucumispora dikerogammari]
MKLAVIPYNIKNGSFDGAASIIFINSKLALHFTEHPNDILIMNNCRFYHRRVVIRLLANRHIAYFFTTLYSPQLNPIEMYFSFLKAKLSAFINTSATKNSFKEKIIGILNS